MSKKQITNNQNKRKLPVYEEKLLDSEEQKGQKLMKKTCIQKDGTKSKPQIKFSTEQQQQADDDDTIIDEENISPKLDDEQIQTQNEVFQQLNQSQNSLNQLLEESFDTSKKQSQKMDKKDIKKGFNLNILPPEIKPIYCLPGKYQENTMVAAFMIGKIPDSNQFYCIIDGKKQKLKLSNQQVQYLQDSFKSLGL